MTIFATGNPFYEIIHPDAARRGLIYQIVSADDGKTHLVGQHAVVAADNHITVFDAKTGNITTIRNGEDGILLAYAGKVSVTLSQGT